jgi:addiction module HigA family antidote
MSKISELEDYMPDIAIPPGDTLIEVLESIGMTQTELATRMGRPIKTINEIIRGKSAITAETAIQLERVLGISAQFWSNLEMTYQTILARLESEKESAKQVIYLDKYPYAEMVRWGWVKQTVKKVEKVTELLNYFGVMSLQNVDLGYTTYYRGAFRHRPSNESLAVWLRQGERCASTISTKSYDASGFRTVLNSAKKLSINLEKDFSKNLTSMCAEIGVAVVYVPHLSKTYVNGATRWLTPDKALIQLSIRNRYEDIFWFTFFHEAAHIILHNKRERFIDFDDPDTSNQELEANKFAADTLIPPEQYREFINYNDLSAKAITDFANVIGVSRGIVVGRLQHDGYISHSRFNRLRRQLQWADN